MNYALRRSSFVFLCATLAILAAASDAASSSVSQRFRPAEGAALKVRVTDSAKATALAEGGARLIADYGSFQLFAANAEAETELAGAGLDNVTFENVIELHAGAVDTRSSVARQARTRSSATINGKQLHLVQFAGPVKPEWYTALVKTRVQIVDYIPHNAYLVYGDSAALQKVQELSASLPALQFQGAFLDADKIHPTARGATSKRQLSPTSEGLYQIQMVADETANADTLAVIDALKLAPIVRQTRSDKYFNVVVKLPPDVLDGLSAQPDIISIWPYVTPRKFDERQGMIVSGNMSGNGPSGPGYLAWLASKGFTQAQFDSSALVVDVTDSGLDNGTTNINHFGLYRGGTTSGISRVRYTRLEGTANSGSTLQGCDGHGNLNAHIIGGYVSLTNFPHTDSAGYRFGLGIAPFVKVGSSVIFDPGEFTSPDYEDLASRAYRDGARVSGNSWGADNAGGYDVDAQQYDAIVRDAQQTGAAVPVAGNQEMTFVFAAGNAGSGAGTVGSPGTAKNVITVGAAENVHSHATTNGGNNASGNDGCTTPDSEANSANDVATFSSRGPCADSRKKPEIMAPGTHVTGGVGQNVKTMAGNGTALPCFDGTGVCALPGGGTAGNTNNFFPLGQKWYSTSSGTSHSTPCVAGGAALIYQWFLNNYSTPPSPAMIKAFLMNAARYMNGTGANDTLYSNNQGMGMMQLGTTFDGTQRLLRDQVTNDIFTASGQTRTFTGTIVSNSKPVRITLTWTDAPGSTSGNAYKNNLDLSVVINGVTYRGNVFSGSASISGGSADVRNNAESVFLPAGTTGSVAITVSGTSINSDGIPNYGTALDQDFALVAYNISETQAPAIALVGSQITAESCGAGNGALDPDELVTVNFALRNVGTANTTNVVATLLATGGVTAPSGAQAYGALTTAGNTVTNPFTFTASGDCGGTVTATLALVDGATDLGSVVYTFTLGGTTAATATNSNPAAITINDNAAGSPYPSSINVSGLAGTVSKVVVTLQGFTHAYPSDVDMILVGPGGQKISLLGGAGGGTGVNNLTLTFDDAAASALGDPMTSGTWLPSGSVASMPGAAPAAPYGTALADFIGSAPNGTWSLYVADAAADDSGSIATGWKLAITAGEPQCCASNQPPVIAAIGSKTVVHSNTLAFAVTAADLVDNDPVTLVASNLPAGATFGVTNGNGTFTWTNAGPLGAYSVTFHAFDDDGFDSEAVAITVNDGSCVSSNMVTEGFDAATTLPAGWTGSGSANDAVATHVQSSPNCRAMGAGDTVITPAVSFPTQIMFYVDSSSGGAGQSGTIEYAVDGGAYASLGSFTVAEAGANEVFDLTSSPDLSASANVTFRFASTFNTWYLDDVIIDGGCGGGAPAQVAPVLAAIGAKSVMLSNNLSFAVTATDANSDAIMMIASNLPAGATFGSTNGHGTFTWNNAAPTGSYSVTFHAYDDDGFDSEAVGITVSATPAVDSNCTMIISEYVEGSSNNKAVEIYNPSASAVDLLAGSYMIQLYVNGGTTPNSSIALTGTVAAGGTYVLVNSSAETALKAYANQQSGSLTHNGNDPLVLRSGGASGLVLDRIGQVGNNANFAADVTTRRKGSVTQGDTNRTAAFTLATQWDSFAVDTFTGLGSHTNDCAGGGGPAGTPPVLGVLTNPSVMVSSSLQFTVTATATDGDLVTLTASNLPAGATFGATNINGTFTWTVATPVGVYTTAFYAADDDGTVSSNVIITVLSDDTDGDGIRDEWELGHFGSLTNLSANSDWDADGFPDLHEYLAGSNPTNQASLLEATATAATPGGSGGFVVTWQSESNKSYLLARSTNLLEGFIGIASNLPAVYPLNSYTDAVATNVSSIYRIELE